MIVVLALRWLYPALFRSHQRAKTEIKPTGGLSRRAGQS
jgi:hypothetical protein